MSSVIPAPRRGYPAVPDARPQIPAPSPYHRNRGDHLTEHCAPGGLVQVRFRTNQLARLADDEQAAARKWGPAVAARYIEAIDTLEAAHRLNDLRRSSGLRLERLKGKRRHQHSIRLGGQWRLILVELAGGDAVAVEEVSNHYE